MTTDPSDATRQDVAVRFLLDADPSPGLLSRLLQPFAKRDLIPDRMWSHRAGDDMHVEIAMDAMPVTTIHLIEGNLRQVVGVRQVAQTRPRTTRQPSSAARRDVGAVSVLSG
jgi:acetolactate synthase regulatory subunit